MITIICGTNRPSNETQKFVSTYKQLLEQNQQQVQVLNLEDLPQNFAFINSIFKQEAPELDKIIEKYISSVKKVVVISPEYNGSFPGVLKTFIDCVPPKYFKDKLIALVGLGAGHGGNLRGNDQLTGIFNYLKAYVVPIKVEIARIWSVTNDEGILNDEPTIKAINEQIDSFIKF
jgi:chromate reductase